MNCFILFIEILVTEIKPKCQTRNMKMGLRTLADIVASDQTVHLRITLAAFLQEEGHPAGKALFRMTRHVYLCYNISQIRTIWLF